MKNYLYIIIILFSFYGCEDQIEIALSDETSKLIIDAVIEVDRTLEECVPVRITTKLSSNYFGSITPVSVNSVKIIVESLNEFGDTATSGTIEIYETEMGSGIYERCLSQSTFNVELVYYLAVSYNDRFYFSRTRYIETATIDSIEQGEITFMSDEDESEIIVTFTDNIEQKNLYIFNFEKGNFVNVEDTFFNGEQYSFSYYFDDQYRIGEEIKVTLLGADREFFNYINLLREQADNEFNLFATPAATIRGNIFDFTDIDNRDQFDNTEATDTFPLGYFAVVEVSKKTIVLK